MVSLNGEPEREVRPRGQRIRMRAQDRRDLVVEKGAELIARFGTYGFSMRSLADAVGLTLPGLAHYVRTREELCTLVIKDRYDNFAYNHVVPSGAIEHAKIDATGSLSYPRYLWWLIDQNEQRPELYRLFMGLQIEAKDPAHPAHGYFSERHARMLEQTMRHPWKLPERFADPEAFADLVKTSYMAMDGAQLHSLTSPDESLRDFWTRADAVLFPSPEWDGCR